MKKLLSIFLSVISITLIAQVPQGVGYQGVATDANGIELVNQAISIRASVLSGSATGAIEWEETHATSTEAFGLFALTIGQGTSTGNGVQANFADISWGTNTHFLKIEMDITGGSNYSFMGTNQMMSVPYALYAESANINYDSISNLLSNDSTFITTVGGGIGGGGCDWRFPEGFDGIAISEDVDYYGDTYMVPSNKRLYILNWNSHGPVINGIHLNKDNFPLILNAGEILKNDDSGGAKSNFNGYLVDKNINLEAISEDVDYYGDTYMVPSNKRLYILNWNSHGPVINGIHLNKDNFPLILNAGEILKNDDSGGAKSNFNGYLVDENYFAGCGGGSSSTATINYDSLANIISMDSTFITTVGGGLGGGGCDIKFPDGLNGEPITYSLASGNSYIVPSGKNLYITNLIANGVDVQIDGITISQNWFNAPMSSWAKTGNTLANPLIVRSGQTISSGFSLIAAFNGLLIDAISYPITDSLTSGNSYTVPSGKNLYITNLIASGENVRIDGITISSTWFNAPMSSWSETGNTLANPLIVKSGQTINNLSGQTGAFNGYLVDENYFAGCGGGGSSGSTSINYDSLATMLSTDSTFIANVAGHSTGSSNHGYHYLNEGSGLYNFIVPNNVYSVEVELASGSGGSGGITCNNGCGVGGNGGNGKSFRVLINCMPNDTITLNIGQNGVSGCNGWGSCSSNPCTPCANISGDGTSGTPSTLSVNNVLMITLTNGTYGTGGSANINGNSSLHVNGTDGNSGSIIYHNSFNSSGIILLDTDYSSAYGQIRW